MALRRPAVSNPLAALEQRYLHDETFHALVERLAALAVSSRLDTVDILEAWVLVCATRGLRAPTMPLVPDEP